MSRSGPAPDGSCRFRSVRPLLLAVGAAVLAPLPAAPAALAQDGPVAVAPSLASAIRSEIGERARGDLRAFYLARGNRPLWLDDAGRISPAAGLLLREVDSARLDGLKPGKLKAGRLEKALERAAEPTPEALAKAELALSDSLVRYVKALRRASRTPMIYESPALAPVVPSTTAALEAAASAPSLRQYVADMAWMHPLYAPLRQGLAGPRYDARQRAQIMRNLERVRALPANPGRRYVLVDAASARLWMYEDGKPVGSMRVVVGKSAQQTPMIAGFIRHAIVNPYWNVPGDLVQSRIAANVVDKGIGYLKHGGYEVLSDWSPEAGVVDPMRIDWPAVAAGTVDMPRVRQLPGKANFMGKVKFEFPNEQGIFLHDTPDKDLLKKDARQFSSGCVRLEDAARLGRWLLDRPLPQRVSQPEQRIALPEFVPVYITYLTAMPERGGIAFRTDVYVRDAAPDGKRPKTELARADRP